MLSVQDIVAAQHRDIEQAQQTLSARAVQSTRDALARVDRQDRYPDPVSAEDILRVAKASGQHTALHICGQSARSLLETADEPVLPWSAANIVHLAERVQVNVGEDFWVPGPEKYQRAARLARALGRPAIIQSREVDGWPDVEHFYRGASRMVPFLFDRSAGTGERSLAWPTPIPGRLVGYAGGIGPDNASELCSCLAETAGARVWLDMETRIREPFPVPQAMRRQGDPPTFVSITKCRAVMDEVGRYFSTGGA